MFYKEKVKKSIFRSICFPSPLISLSSLSNVTQLYFLLPPPHTIVVQSRKKPGVKSCLGSDQTA
jgi:hypothetical protein